MKSLNTFISSTLISKLTPHPLWLVYSFLSPLTSLGGGVLAFTLLGVRKQKNTNKYQYLIMVWPNTIMDIL